MSSDQLFSASAKNPFRVLFVCLGNICRSPTAEGVFLDLVKKQDRKDHFIVDSAGLGAWHVGEPPHRVTQAVAISHGVHLPSIGRQFSPADFDRFDLILAMDRENLAGILQQAPDNAAEAKVRLFRDFDPEQPGSEVPDPYYGDRVDFENVFLICRRSAEGLLKRVS